MKITHTSEFSVTQQVSDIIEQSLNIVIEWHDRWQMSRAERAMTRLAMSDPRVARDIQVAKDRAEWH
ncbi:MAG: hypothetical protein AB8C46_13140 [Burkholderiaceae bacterium]